MAKRKLVLTGSQGFDVQWGYYWAHLRDGPAKGDCQLPRIGAYHIVKCGAHYAYYRLMSSNPRPSLRADHDLIHRHEPDGIYNFSGYLPLTESAILDYVRTNRELAAVIPASRRALN